MAKDLTSIRLHPAIEKLVSERAAAMHTTKTYVIEEALALQFGAELPDWFRPGMRHIEEKDNE